MSGLRVCKVLNLSGCRIAAACNSHRYNDDGITMDPKLESPASRNCGKRNPMHQIRTDSKRDCSQAPSHLLRVSAIR